MFIGGGTPTLLSKRQIKDMMDALYTHFDIEKGADITIEANPGTVNKGMLRSLRAMGINRISFGLQSANDNELKLLGRVHSFEDFKRTFLDAREAGFENIRADLMYGIPHQTRESFRNTLNQLISLSPEHISAYGLKVEEGTAFARLADKGKLILPDEDTEFALYCDAEKILSESGDERYERRHFAKRG